MEAKRFAFIDALRGIASLGVVLFHAVEGNHIGSLPEWLRYIVSFGGAGVPLFFVISGFVIAHSLQDQRMTPASLGRFMLRRSIRLDPPYWVAIAIAIAASLLSSRLFPDRAQQHFSLGQIAAHIAYLQNILGFNNINPVFWTLCYEVQFYAVFAALLFAPSRFTLPVALAVSLLWCYRLGPDLPGFFPDLWYAFLLGAVAWYGWMNSAMGPVFLAYFMAVLFAAIWHADKFAVECCVCAAVIFVVAKAGMLTTSLRWRPLQFLGAISYSLYLLHNPATGAVFRVSRYMGDGAISQAVRWAASIAVCVFMAWVFYRLVERPCMRLSREAFKAPTTN
jgi:peptidoglycan/LPS O-acetylase OafA/YrhL